MKLAVFIVLGMALAGIFGFFMLAQKTKAGTAPGLVNGALAPCPASPNCVSSETGTDAGHVVDPFPLRSWDRLPDLILAMGGRLIEVREDYLAAEFSTKLMGFVDDVEFRKADDSIHVRSASRVGHSDMGANRKRIEALHTALTE